VETDIAAQGQVGMCLQKFGVVAAEEDVKKLMKGGGGKKSKGSFRRDRKERGWKEAHLASLLIC